MPNQDVWINPIGGLGDTLMLSGVLKQLVEQRPHQRFRLVRRPGYMNILEGHPAILGVGFPRYDDEILSTDYWTRELPGVGRQRPMQIMGRMFKIDNEIEERFYVAHENLRDPLIDLIPWGSKNIVIAPGSTSPRKEWALLKMEALTRKLKNAGYFVIQIGDARQRHVRFTYSLLGVTQPALSR